MMHAPFLKHQQHPQAAPDKLRHYCRNPKCRSKLGSPVENERDAFCCRGCHGSFYRHRCLACEREMPRNAEHQKVCHRADCKEKWRQKTIISRFVGRTSTPDGNPLENPLKPGVKTGLKPRSDPGRPWHRVAGPSLSPRTFAAAVVSDVIPDGPDGQWVGGSFERIEAENRKRLKEHLAKLAKDCLYQRDTPPTNLLGGYKFPGAPTAADLDLAKSTATVPDKIAAETARLIATIPANLSILNFLKRPPPESTCDQVDRFNTGAP